MLLMLGTAALLGMLRWTLTRDLSRDELLGFGVWTTLVFLQLTAMVWMIVNPTGRYATDWLRVASLPAGGGLLLLWLTCQVSITTPWWDTETFPGVQFAVTLGMAATLICLPLVFVSIAVNLFRHVDRALLIMQLAALASSAIGLCIAFPRSLLS